SRSPRHSAPTGRVSPSLPTVTTVKRMAACSCWMNDMQYREPSRRRGSAVHQLANMTIVSCRHAWPMAESQHVQRSRSDELAPTDLRPTRPLGLPRLDAALGLRVLGSVPARHR